VQFIKNNMTEKQKRDAAFGEYSAWASGGKRVLRTMPDWMKLKLIEWGSHVAHHGPIIPIEAWRIDKKKCCGIDQDASNIFDIAEKIL